MTTHSLRKPSFLSSKALAILAIAIGVPFLSFYWLALARFIPDTAATNLNWITPLSIVFYLPFAFAAYIFFTNLYVYGFITVVGLIAAIVGLKWGQYSLFFRVWLILTICAIVAFPIIYRYQPALVAASGYKMQVVTDPGFFGGIIKASQNLTEQTPCRYKVLGWSVSNQLYYQTECGEQAQLWQYSLSQSNNHTQASSTPIDLSVSTVSEDEVLEMVRAGGVRPEKAEAMTRPILLKSKGFVSSDKQWTAIVVQHIYGTQDVIILAETD